MTNDPADELLEQLKPLRAFALSLCRDGATADDLVQETILKAWANIDKFEQGTNMRAWLFTILRNTYYTLYRKRARQVDDPEGTLVGQMSEKPAHDGRLAMRDFARAFEQIKDEQREVLILVGGAGFSYEEAAEMCGVAVGTIKSRANRGRAHLAELMGLSEGDTLDLTDAATLAIVTSKPAA